jgi:hypothetical protein
MKTRPQFGALHDKSFRNIDLATSPLFPLRNGIHLQHVGTMLVRQGSGAAADTGSERRLPVPRLPAQAGCGNIEPFFILSSDPRHCKARKPRSHPTRRVGNAVPTSATCRKHGGHANRPARSRDPLAFASSFVRLAMKAWLLRRACEQQQIAVGIPNDKVARAPGLALERLKEFGAGGPKLKKQGFDVLRVGNGK